MSLLLYVYCEDINHRSFVRREFIPIMRTIVLFMDSDSRYKIRSRLERSPIPSRCEATNCIEMANTTVTTMIKHRQRRKVIKSKPLKAITREAMLNPRFIVSWERQDQTCQRHRTTCVHNSNKLRCLSSCTPLHFHKHLCSFVLYFSCVFTFAQCLIVIVRLHVEEIKSTFSHTPSTRGIIKQSGLLSFFQIPRSLFYRHTFGIIFVHSKSFF